jgi:HEAT repeat protein
MDTVDKDLSPETFTTPEVNEMEMAAQARELALSLSKALAQEQTTEGKIQLINRLSGIYDPSVVDALLMALEPGESREVRDEATRALSTFLQPEVWYGNTDGLDYFVYALDPDLPVKVRASAVRVLEYTNDARVESILQDLRNDSDPEIRTIAMDALERRGKRNYGNPTGE